MRKTFYDFLFPKIEKIIKQPDFLKYNSNNKAPFFSYLCFIRAISYNSSIRISIWSYDYLNDTNSNSNLQDIGKIYKGVFKLF